MACCWCPPWIQIELVVALLLLSLRTQLLALLWLFRRFLVLLEKPVYSSITVILQRTVARPSCGGELAYEWKNEWLVFQALPWLCYSMQGHSTEHIHNSRCRFKKQITLGHRLYWKKFCKRFPCISAFQKDIFVVDRRLTITYIGI
jgi:hypothetical protein